MKKIYVSKEFLQKTVIVVLIFLVGIIVWGRKKTPDVPDESWIIQEESLVPMTDPEISKEVKLYGIHVTGAVMDPDQILYLPEGSRVGEAIAAAGGPTEEADLGQLNLAGYIQDGQRIYVPRKGEVTATIENSPGENEQTLLTNINLATKIDLLDLPGIGETYAQRIIDYREQNGPFESIEDIMKVKGIGESKFNEIKDLITV